MKRMSILMALMLGLFVVACEVEDDADTTDDTAVAETTDTTEEDAGDTDPCITGECSEECAATGLMDIDCMPTGAECKEAYASTMLQAWKDGQYTDVMSENTLNCDWTPGICDAQFRCRDIHCFCDPDCYVEDAAEAGTYLDAPVCSDDAHCDSWCPTGVDPDCASEPDKDGKYCG